MNTKTKNYIIYTILSVAILVILIIAIDHFTTVNRPVIQGTIECKSYIASSKIAGRIDSIFVDEGDWVERGDLLYTISTPELDNKLKQAQALRSEARSLQHEVDKGARKEQIEAAHGIVMKAEAGATLAEATYNRIAALYAKGVIARQQYDKAKAELEAMKANLQAAKAEYNLIKEGATQDQRDIVAAKYSETQYAVELVNLYIDDGAVTSPTSGRVSTIISNSGELIGEGYPVVTILDLEDCWATFNIRESEMGKISYGAHLNAYIPALEQWAEFTIYYIASEADFATWTATRARGGFDIRTFEVRAKCNNKNLRILPGMSVIIYDI
jgi:HlyD family secretion protein